MAIVVFGSINVDLVVRTPHLPVPGETIQGTTFNTTPGGKGANQAVACARLGAPTRLIGRIGTDSFGDELLANLQANRVNASGVQRAANTSSGVAVIAVDDRAENTIIVIPGANGTIDHSDLAHLETALEGAGALLMQLEIGLDHVTAAAQMARARGIPVILDPAPARPLPASLYPLIDVITPNETEAALLVGFAIGNEADAERAARQLIGMGVHSAVIKMGAKGALGLRDGNVQFQASYKVEAIDTVAAGDAFNAAFAVALSEGQSFAESIRWGAVAGALATTRRGAQNKMPTRSEVLSLFKQN